MSRFVTMNIVRYSNVFANDLDNWNGLANFFSFECECVLMVDKWKGCPCVCLCLLFCLCHKRVFDGLGVRGGAQWAKSGGEAVLLQSSDFTKDPMHDFNRLFC